MSGRDIWTLALDEQPNDTNATSFLHRGAPTLLELLDPAASHLAHL